MNIVMPMAGLGKRLFEYGYKEPKPLIKILGKTIMEWSIETVKLKANFIFCCKKEHIENYEIDKKLKQIVPDCNIVSINYQTEGTAQTILEAKDFINNDEELFISDSDHCILWDVFRFNSEVRNRDVDACVMIFPEEHNSNALSYVKLNDKGYVTESAEKAPISNIAAAGMHYFKKGSDFVKYANIMIKKNHRFNGEFYVTPVYNELVQDGKKIITYPIIKKWAMGSSDEINAFLREYKDKQKLI